MANYSKSVVIVIYNNIKYQTVRRNMCKIRDLKKTVLTSLVSKVEVVNYKTGNVI